MNMGRDRQLSPLRDDTNWIQSGQKLQIRPNF